MAVGVLTTLWRNSPTRETVGRWPSQAVPNQNALGGSQIPASTDHISVIPSTNDAEEAFGGEQAVAAWVLGLGGRVDDVSRGIEQLGKVRYPIVSVAFDGTAVDDTSLPRLLACPYLERIGLRDTGVSVAGLQSLRGIYDLHLLDLGGNRQFSDADLDELARFTTLFSLNLDRTSVTLAGIDRLGTLPRLMNLAARGIAGTASADSKQHLANRAARFLCLNELDLSGAAIDDDDLPSLATMTGLLSLNLADTKVTDAAIAQLHHALGDCWILGADGQTHAPPPRPGNPDRVAAERLLEIGYTVTIARPHEQIVSAVSGLPDDEFRLVWVGPGPGTVDDADLRLLAPCRQLSVIHLWGSQTATLAGISELRGLTKLAHLNLSDLPRLSDDVLPILAKLPSLRTVGFRFVPITDSGLRQLPYMPRLEFIDLSGTRITGAGLKHLSNLPGLRQLLIADIKVNDADLAPLQAFGDLEYLDLSGTNIKGAALEPLSHLRHIRRLWLSRNRLIDADVERLAPFKELQELALDGTNMGDAGVARLAEMLKGLLWLNIRDMAVSADGLRALRGLPRLRHLIVGGEIWLDAEEALAAVSQLRQIETLELIGPHVTDAASRSLRELHQLKSLQLTNTMVTADGIAALKAALPDCTIIQ